MAKRANSAAANRANTPLPHVTLRIPDDTAVSDGSTRVIEIVPGPFAVKVNLRQQDAMRWRYRLENRLRLMQLESAEDMMANEAVNSLAKWGFSEVDLERIAQAEIVEVAIPFETEEHGWETRIFPWEFILTAATESLRPGDSLTVVRHLVRPKSKTILTNCDPPTFAIVEAAPGQLAAAVNYEHERDAIRAAFGAGQRCRVFSDVPLNKLTTSLESLSPDIVYLTAVDNRLAADYISRTNRSPGPPSPVTTDKSWTIDGIVLPGSPSPENAKDGQTPLEPVGFEALVNCLTAAEPAPKLIGFNVWHSASRIAALCVARGVSAAIGFQTIFDESLATLFYENFYRCYRQTGWCNVLSAFESAWKAMKPHRHRMVGTGVVLWTAESQLASWKKEPRADVQPKIETQRLRDPDVLRDVVSFAIRPVEQLNYSLLQNNRPLFDEFKIRTDFPHQIGNVRVEVQLQQGPDNYSFVNTLQLDSPVQDIYDHIRIPLTFALTRRVDENIHLLLQARVSIDGTVFYEDTHRVTLAPIDQWTDTDDNRQWLPSFVLPRDPGVLRIIKKAEDLLKCLADDATAGFDGYQAIDLTKSDPEAAVDNQVRAIWMALILHMPVGYINPPPTYESTSQRLRTPSQVLDSGRGTCIDLALMLAACLEYIDLYPVIFLTDGHAFPGYWRSPEAYDEFIGLKQTDSMHSDELRAVNFQQVSWMLGNGSYAEIMGFIKRGDLVPLESTWIPGRKGFSLAKEKWKKAPPAQETYQTLVDIRLARMNRPHPVTPLAMYQPQ